MNCGDDAGKHGTLFQEVFVCPKCHVLASRALARCEQELAHCMRIVKEKIREKLATGTFATNAEEPASLRERILGAVETVYHQPNAEQRDGNDHTEVPE